MRAAEPHRRVFLADAIAKRTGSVDPSKFPDETFELLSIPAFDAGKPEILKGNEIGSSKQIVQEGDVLLSKIVPHIRRSWIVRPQTDHRLIASGEWIVFRSEDFDAGYLRHLLVSDVFHAEFMQTVSGVGGSLLRARPSEVAKISIPQPSPEEQKRIAAVLDKADSLRRKRQQATHLADDFLRAVFLEMFGKKDRNAALGDYVDVLSGFAFRSENYIVDSGARLLRGVNVGIGACEWKDTAFYPQKLTQELGRYELHEGDVVLAMDRPWISNGLKCAVINKDIAGSLLVQRVARLRAKGIPCAQFIYQCLIDAEFQRHCRVTETTIPHISPTDLATYPIPEASPQELERFAAIAAKAAALARSGSDSNERIQSLALSLQNALLS